VVYTKIYPRYKSRKNISFARDDFSNWLAPHESSKTDIILVGHSLGGILAAEVVLIPSNSPAGSNELFQHRILGLIAFDTPFLGMHPGVVGTGIASLFRPPPQPLVLPPADPKVFLDTGPPGPTYNPTYANDIILTDRTGKLRRFWYFWNKHCGELAKAAGDYVSSHLEFGGCLADYPGLKRRFNAVRALEDIDETAKPRTPDGKFMRRVRFVNYYSTSTGPVKERSPSPSTGPGLLEPPTSEVQETSTRRSSGESLRPSTVSSPRISLEEHRDGELTVKDIAELNIDPDPPELTPATTRSEQANSSSATDASVSSLPPGSAELGLLPPLPPLPAPPAEFDAGLFKEEDIVKLLRNEHDRKVKAYERAVKDREESLRGRQELIERRQRNKLKQEEKTKKQAQTQEVRVRKEQKKRAATSILNPENYDRQLHAERESKPQEGRKLKDRKFCALPPKDPATGKPDDTWIRVYFEGIDEVTAHTSMFNISDTYAKTVADVVERIETWVAEDASTRMTLAEMEP
jgi:pimeloyl-ACP methyl ester carboxylesterase